jgi:hypothetical protein
MIAVSDAWKDIHQRFLLPEGHIEIKCELSEVGLQELVVPSGTNEAVFSNVGRIVDTEESSTPTKYATNEINMWVLDGSMSILPDTPPYESSGYVSDLSESGSVTLTLPEVRTVAIPGVTITWSDTYGEYPQVFTVTAKNGETVVAELTVTDNTEKTCLVDLELVDYDSVTITVHSWCLPYRRARIESVALGHTLIMTKRDILSYTHEQHGDLLSAEIPKNSIEFSLNNIDGRWNPNNPTGMEKYLSERQKLTVRYGFNMDDGTVEWIKAGTFYLSEWSAPSNGLEARFTARDVLEFIINAENKASAYDTLENLARWATDSLPDNTVVEISESLKNYSAEYLGDTTSAIVVQKCANAGGCIIRYDRDGVLHIEPLSLNNSGYLIPLSLSYSYPELELSKPLKTVSVDYGSPTPYTLSVGSSGETQTVNNNFIKSEAQAKAVAELVRDTLKSRKKIKGEFRADPRLDLFDIVVVESKYGYSTGVVITNIKYTFNGAFHGSYEGRMIDGVAMTLGDFLLDVSTLE